MKACNPVLVSHLLKLWDMKSYPPYPTKPPLILLELMTCLKAYIEKDLKLPKIVLGVKVASDCTENPPNAEEK